MPEVAPSLLSADFARLGDELKALQAAGVRIAHLDVMDGCFVPNLTIGPPVIKALRKECDLLFDVHLMIDRPDRYLDRFAEAGADLITIHYEASADPEKDLKAIRALGKKAGISIKPGTGADVLAPLLPLTDLVLVMSVEPGFGGQSFLPSALPKLSRLRELREELGLTFLLEVDGGINRDTLLPAAEAGADWLVMGSAFFREKNYPETFASLSALLADNLK
ncbi:MAG: ribulose-phosphate 3-epimerase, partial [Clostridia bacterium]|nr:ribulose-phosphate 3-epimerase [Clostridia bacterium]